MQEEMEETILAKLEEIQNTLSTQFASSMQAIMMNPNKQTDNTIKQQAAKIEAPLQQILAKINKKPKEGASSHENIAVDADCIELDSAIRATKS
eukprot:93104-Ditylum_brightwellii.AAC.1